MEPDAEKWGVYLYPTQRIESIISELSKEMDKMNREDVAAVVARMPDESEGYQYVPFKKVGTINVKFKEAVPLPPCGSDDDEAEFEQQPTGEPCLSWILGKLAKQPEKKERTLAVLQRAMSELVGLEAE